MAIPKKGTRRIRVDDESYLWLIRKKATYTQWAYGDGRIHIAVEHAEVEGGAVLLIYTDRKHPEDWATTKVIAVNPSDVAKWIRQAIKKGWNPKANHGQSSVKIENEKVKTV